MMIATLATGAGCSADFREKFTSLMKDEMNKESAPSDVKDAPDPRIAPETHFASGMMLERQGDYVGAAAQFSKAVDGDPKMVDAHNRLGMCFCRLSEFDRAAASFRRAIEMAPDAAALQNNLGYCLTSAGKYSEAENSFRRALELVPDFERARMNLGIALARQRRLGDAAVEFSRVVPAEAAYYNVGVICMEMNEKTHAERAFRESLAVKPDYEPAQKRLALLANPPVDVAAPKTVQKDRRRIVEPPRVTVRANEPVGVMTLAGDTGSDAPSP
jgi:Tfp pilus assembly protein PilF